MARRGKKRVLRKRIAIVGDGHTERIYFHQMSQYEDLGVSGIDIKPELPDNKGWSKAIDRASQLAEDGYDRVYAIVDLDVIYQKDLIDAFKSKWEVVKERSKNKVKLIRCYPCFELWFLLHYSDTTKLFRNCDECVTELINYVDDYSKSGSWLKRNKIYDLLKPNQGIAISNGKKINKLAKTSGQITHSVCDVQNIVNHLLKK